MGRTRDEEGESSTQTCDLEDSDERPLKKARYIWQIKGKYHLKKPGDEEKDKVKHSIPDHASPISDSENLGTPTELESSKTHMEVEAESVVSTVVAERNSVVDQQTGMCSQHTPHEVQQLADSVYTWELRKWQDRQMTRGFIDNTINKVIEIMGLGFLPFDAGEITDEEFPIVENENDDDVEDEAVLMAIHSHGLQRSEQEEQEPRTQRCCEDKMSTVPCVCKQQAANSLGNETPYPFHQRPALSDTRPDQPCSADAHVKQEPALPVSDKNSFLNVFPSSAIVCNNFQSCKEESPIEVLVESPVEMCTVAEPQVGSVELSSDVGTQSEPASKGDKNSYFEHNDFLDQAVGVAIQKKGLSTLSCLEFG